MIHEIRISNFGSIRDEQHLDLRIPATAPDLERFRRSPARPDVRLPTVIGLFGPNASGKSTFLRAMTATAQFLVLSVDSRPQDLIAPFVAFNEKSAWSKSTVVEVELDGWLIGNRPALYRYELELGSDPSGPIRPRVIHEALLWAPETRMRRLFQRDTGSVRASKEFGLRPSDQRLDFIRPNASLLSTLAKFNHPIAQMALQAIAGLRSNLWTSRRSNLPIGDALAFYHRDPAALERLSTELQRIDTGISGMRLDQGQNGLEAWFDHSGLEKIPYALESSGTQQIMLEFPLLFEAISSGSAVVMDELDTDLHPLIVPEILKWFQTSADNQLDAQLFFSSHHATVLDHLEKEEVFLTSKSTEGATTIYGAKDIVGLRREPALSRKYLGGMLGAVPQIG